MRGSLAGMAESVDAADSKSAAERREGSSPSSGTTGFLPSGSHAVRDAPTSGSARAYRTKSRMVAVRGVIRKPGVGRGGSLPATLARLSGVMLALILACGAR